MKGIEIIGSLHKEISKILIKEGRKSGAYLDDFLSTISQAIEKLEIFPYHIVWENVSEKLPGNRQSEEKSLLRDATKKVYKDTPFDKGVLLKYPEIKCFQLPFTGKEFTGKVKDYFTAGKLKPILELPVKEEFSHCDLPIFSGSAYGEDELEPTWILTLIYKKEDKGQVDSKEFFEFMEFFSVQLSLVLDKFSEDIADKFHKRINNQITDGEKGINPSNEEALKTISRVLAKEFQADLCLFFLVDEQGDTLQLESGNIELSGKINHSLTGDSDIVISYKENRVLRVTGKENLTDIINSQILVELKEQLKPIEHCICIPIVLEKTKLGTIGLFRSKTGNYQATVDKSENAKQPFSEFETNLLKKVQNHIFDIIISYFTYQQRVKDMRNVIEQVTAPVKSLVGQVDGIIKGKIPKEKIREKLVYINKLSKISLKYATNFEKILEFDSRQVNLKKEKLYDLRDYLIGIAMEYQSLIRKKCININVTKQTANNINLNVDKELFYRTFANIIDNTVKYSFFPEERSKLGFQAKPSSRDSEENVLITAEEENNSVIITIRSLGLEISDDEKNKIFDRWFRGLEARKRFNVGGGIGLYIAKKIIELHGGKLEIVPGSNKYNTVFKIILPKGEVD